MKSREKILLSVSECAAVLGLSPQRLFDLRAGRKGPAFIRDGRRLFYSVDAVRAWIVEEFEKAKLSAVAASKRWRV